jgi:hypothetical protein
MKKLIITTCIAMFFLFSNNTFAQEKTKMKEDDSKIKQKGDKYKEKNMDAMSYPYKAEYSSNFSIGNPKHSKMILELWKDWDDNAFDRHDYFADTVVMFFPDGSMIKGKDSAMAGARRYRGSMQSATSVIQAFIPLRSNDRNEDWVAVWGTETDTFADGKTQTRDLQEIWRINKDGKVAFMKQFSSEPPKQ